MSEVNLPSLIPVLGQVMGQDADAVSADIRVPRGEHEDGENVELEDAISTTERGAGDETHLPEPASQPIFDTQLDESLAVDQVNTADLPEPKASSATAKPKPSVNPPRDKPTGPATTVKKVRVQRVDVIRRLLIQL
jgi:hypothetical protein